VLHGQVVVAAGAAPKLIVTVEHLCAAALQCRVYHWQDAAAEFCQLAAAAANYSQVPLCLVPAARVSGAELQQLRQQHYCL
jgi:hypothetical protein